MKDDAKHELKLEVKTKQLEINFNYAPTSRHHRHGEYEMLAFLSVSIGLNILLFSIVIGIGLLIAIIPCSLFWYFSKRLPLWLRFLFITFIAASLCTPVGVSGEGGGGMAPSVCVLPDFFYNDHDTSRSHAGLTELIEIGIMWSVLYISLMAIVGIAHFVKKVKAYQISDDKPLISHSHPSSPSEGPRLAFGATADEKLTPLVKRPERDSTG
jgi:hypothetical protein